MRKIVLVLLVAGGLAGCSNNLLSAQGQSCNSSEECAPGLLCDYGKPPKDKSGRGTCGSSETVGRDMSAATTTDGAVPDLASQTSD